MATNSGYKYTAVMTHKIKVLNENINYPLKRKCYIVSS